MGLELILKEEKYYVKSEGNLLGNKMSQHMRLCIFKMLTQKREDKHKELFTVRLWIPDIAFTASNIPHKFPVLILS